MDMHKLGWAVRHLNIKVARANETNETKSSQNMRKKSMRTWRRRKETSKTGDISANNGPT
jgi:hypothetical protein